jgi:dihydropteroate synthase
LAINCIEIKNREQATRELAAIGCDQWGVQHMTGKAVFRVLKLKDLTPTQANIIKQEILSAGGEAAVSRGVVNHSVDLTDMLMMATEMQYKKVCSKLKMQPFKLKHLAGKIERVLNNLEANRTWEMDCRGKMLTFGERTLVMGILNVTPDSFSDGGKHNLVDQALEHALKMVEDGADIIDIGGESTRPGFTAVTVAEELERVVPVVKKLATQINVPISLDTTKAEVAKQALEAGAHIINDIWAGQADVNMFSVAAQYKAPVMLMHNQQGTEYKDLMFDIIEFLEQTAEQALQAGVDKDKIIIDPGVGFGKTHQQNLAVMRHLNELKLLGYPILLGTSRKSIIAKTLNLPVDQRMEGTAATVALGIAKGVDLVRVHDVKEMVRVCKMTDAIVRGDING